MDQLRSKELSFDSENLEEQSLESTSKLRVLQKLVLRSSRERRKITSKLLEQVPSSPRPSRTQRLTKEARVIFKELRSAQVWRGKCVVHVVGFTSELHGSPLAKSCFRWQAVWFIANTEAGDARALINIQTKPHNRTNWSACSSMYANINCNWVTDHEWVTVNRGRRSSRLQRLTCDRMCESARGRSRRMIGHAFFISRIPRHFGLPLPPLNELFFHEHLRISFVNNKELFASAKLSMTVTHGSPQVAIRHVRVDLRHGFLSLSSLGADGRLWVGPTQCKKLSELAFDDDLKFFGPQLVKHPGEH